MRRARTRTRRPRRGSCRTSTTSLLAHADRTRVLEDGLPRRIGIGKPTVLVDGVVAAIWKLVKTRASATLRIEPFGRLRKADREAVAEEGERLLAFAAADGSTRGVEFAS